MNFLPIAASTFAGDIDRLILLVTVLVGVGFVVAEGLLIYSAMRFRASGPTPRKAAFLDGNAWRQSRWVLIPVAVVLGGDLYIDIKTDKVWHAVKVELPPADLTVRVTAQRFAWVIDYPGPDGRFDTADDIQRMNELRVPVGKNVVFNLRARDVLHSFFVPALRVKQDAVPGRTIPGWFNVTTPGDYLISCTQICGAGHSAMPGRLIALPEAEFASWLATAAPGGAPGAVLNGADVARVKGCAACHSTDGKAGIGPSWKGLWGSHEVVVTRGTERTVTVDEAYFRSSVLEPAADVVKGFQAVMPPMKGLISDAELAALIAYVQTLR